MKAASIHDIKQELKAAQPAELLELCLRLAKYKKENKELLAYLLFDAHNEPAYITSVKEEIDSQFAEVTTNNLYLAKKSLRKILKLTNKHIKYTASKQAEVELLVHYCTKLKNSGITMQVGSALYNLYTQQLKKINTALEVLHEDLRHDYKKSIAYITDIPQPRFEWVLGKKRNGK
jgi:hypothetical protein